MHNNLRDRLHYGPKIKVMLSTSSLIDT